MMIADLAARVRNFRRLHQRYGHTRNVHRVETQLVVLRRIVGETLRGTLHESEARAVRQLAYVLDEMSRRLPAGRPAARSPKVATLITAMASMLIRGRYE